jgi:superfamily II DNA or RNA helicase
LLADEVGLGKTIEAGMIWQALFQRGQAKRTLIITPAGLTTQWQEEMKDKFGADFEIFGRDFTGYNPRIWNFRAQSIASLDRLKRKENKRLLLENHKWDLIIFDEAHRLSAVNYGRDKTHKTENFKLAEALRLPDYSEAFLLLTATPHQGEANHSRFKNLLTLLDEGIDFSALDEQFPLLPVGETGRKFTDFVIRTPKKDVTDAEGRKVFKGRQTHRLPATMYADEKAFYTAVEEYIRNGYKMLERVSDSTQQRATGFLLTTFQKLNASSTAAIRAALQGRLVRLRGELCDIPPEEGDEDLRDDRFEGEYEESYYEEYSLKNDREIMEEEISALEQLLAMPVKRDKKLTELLGLTDHIAKESPRGDEEKVLIFTEYRQTQRYLVAELEKKYGKGAVVVIHGGMKLERLEENQREIESLWTPFAKDGAVDTATTKRTSQRLFREHRRVRFLVSTEAGGEGINLQFCHICINFDLPWNPMRVEQRVGRVYRYGQDKVVQVFHLFNKGTVEDQVQAYFEDRVAHAAKAIAKVTGEDPEDIKGSLNGQLESEIDPKEIYKRALVEGNLNKQTQKEIEEAVRRAKQAYEIATQSLFRDCSSYSFDKYKNELATDLSLADLQCFTERFLGEHRRQLQKKDEFFEFIVPEVLKPWKLPVDRYRNATFDRDLAIRRNEAEFLALGHPFVEAMLEYAGSYDFGGLASYRSIQYAKLAGRKGYLFLFVVRQRVQDTLDECMFQFCPVFVGKDGKIDDDATAAAVTGAAKEEKATHTAHDAGPYFSTARQHLEQSLSLWSWDDDVEFLGLSWVEFR